MMMLSIIFLLVALLIVLFRHFRLIDQYKKVSETERDQTIKMTEFYDILIRWMQLYQEEKELSSWLMKKGYKRIAVYGMRELGVLFYNELLHEKMNVVCAIDKNGENMNLGIDVIKPSADLPDVDVVIVTAPHYYQEIKYELNSITQADIVSIEDIIFEI